MNKRILIFLAIVFSFCSTNLNGQILDNKVNIYLSVGTVKSLGKKEVDENKFITPSFYNNFEKSKIFSFRGTYKFRKNLSLGVEVKQIRFSDWSHKKNSLFYNSFSSSLSFAPLFKIQTSFRRKGILNRFTTYIALAPSINFIKARLVEDVFEVAPSSYESEIPLESNITSFGVAAYVGGEYSILQGFGIFLEGGIHYVGVKGHFYNDKTFYGLNGSVGLFLKFFKNKRYYQNSW